jgi:hypothetical protein
VDIMLSPAAAFEGGALCTLEASGQLAQHPFEQGEATVFVVRLRSPPRAAAAAEARCWCQN